MKKLSVIICLLLVGNIVSAQEFADVSRTEFKNDAGQMGSKSGFFQALYPTNYPTGATGWWHLLDVRHNNVSNNFSMQFSGSFFDQNLYFRKTHDNPATAWSRVLLENSQGLVGVGTTSPAYKLHVSNGTVYVDPGANNGFRAGSYLTMGNMNLGNSPFISFNATLTTSNISTGQNLFTPTYASGSGLIIKGDAGGSGLHFLQKNYGGNSGQVDLNSFNEVITLDQAGRLGIGTANPSNQLDVYSPNNDPTIRIVSGNAGAWITAQSTNSFYAGVKLIGNNGTQNWSAGMTNGNSNYSLSGSLDGATNRFFNITYNGNIGIGTDVPMSKLSIYEAGSSNNQWKGRVDFGGDNARVVAGEYNGTAYLGAVNSSINAWTNLVINVDGGLVGIGTKTPTEKLCVNGNIKTKKLIVTQLGWSDYVFAPEYKLLPLQDLETYIKQHQHLPDVPSASEVAANGIDLGDNQAILLKKIEELTLYMIEQQKSIEKLKAENLLLFKKVEKLEK